MAMHALHVKHATNVRHTTSAVHPRNVVHAMNFMNRAITAPAYARGYSSRAADVLLMSG
ncbi:hypothetical protein [Streptomyces griseus]|uniref:hypothetical protein n=1 Tax=Streptomyces griseus TaxID=1911 RepID=UPI00365D1E67